MVTVAVDEVGGPRRTPRGCHDGVQRVLLHDPIDPLVPGQAHGFASASWYSGSERGPIASDSTMISCWKKGISIVGMGPVERDDLLKALHRGLGTERFQVGVEVGLELVAHDRGGVPTHLAPAIHGGISTRVAPAPSMTS